MLALSATLCILIDEQAGFCNEQSCTDSLFTLQHIIDKRRKFNLSTFLLFLDVKEAYDRIHCYGKL
jgi:hypothetical protein